jgi:hypothetical protein
VLFRSLKISLKSTRISFLSLLKRVIIKMKIGIEEEEIGWLTLK